VPLIAVHLFVFYFGILADDTPPVGLAAFAAAGISGGDPIRTGIQGFTYDIRTAILPFIFIFNTELLMIGIGSPLHFIVVVSAAIIAMLVFAAATQGFWLIKNRIWETLGLLLAAFILFRPGFFWDQLYPELNVQPADNLIQIVEKMEPGSQLRMELKGERMDGSEFTMVVMLPVGDEPSGAERLQAIGVETREEEGSIFVDTVVFGSAAEKARLDFDQQILNVQVPNERPPKQLMFIPAMLLLGLIWFLQRGRIRKQQSAAA
jgi:hypothetical protein